MVYCFFFVFLVFLTETVDSFFYPERNSVTEGIKSQLSHPLCCAVTPREEDLS